MPKDYILTKQYNVGIYIRLSQEDRGKKYESDSVSIENQRNFLKRQVKERKFNLIKEYVDDGYSGMNFERPGFKEMIKDIEDKKINVVMVKDFSRLGRDHIETGNYIEKYFPEKRVRFISVTEDYDSEGYNNDSYSFIMASNDFQSRQTSKKIRTILSDKRKEGKFVGSSPAYGYMRDPNDKGHLIPDPQTAPIVKEIFEKAKDGFGPYVISTYLNEKGYQTPSKYKNLKNNTEFWGPNTVKRILGNKMYLGDMIQHKEEMISCKVHKKRLIPEEEQDIKKNTHEALVSLEDYNIIHKRKKKHKNREYCEEKVKETRLFDGLIFCKECGNKLTITYRKNKDYWTVNCNRYSKNPKLKECTPHFFPYNYLEEQLISNINKVLSDFMKSLDIERLNNKLISNADKRNDRKRETLKNLERERQKLADTMTELFMQKSSNEITTETYNTINKNLEDKIKEINKQIKENSVEDKSLSLNKIPNYTDRIKKLLDLKEPKRELLYKLIERIEIDSERKIYIIFKYHIIETYSFKYEEMTKPRNPYGKRGKQHINKVTTTT